MTFNKSVQPFTDEYKETCFRAWYAAGCPSIASTRQVLPDDINGRRPSDATLTNWRDSMQWVVRAQNMDAEVQAIVNQDLIANKAELLKHQYDTALALAKKASDQLLSESLDSSNAAVQLYFKSTLEARQISGISEALQKIGDMTNDELQKYVGELAERVGLVDATPVEEHDETDRDYTPTET